MAIQAAQPAMSLTPEGGEDGDRQLDIPVESPEEELADRISLAEVIEALPEQDKQLIRLRFYGNRTQSETAKALHTTQVQISRRERKILKVMRVMEEIDKVHLTAPVRIGQIAIENVCGLGADVVVTKNMDPVG